jgi:hypothetical protein
MKRGTAFGIAARPFTAGRLKLGWQAALTKNFISAKLRAE